MADNLGVNQTSYSSDDEKARISIPQLARGLVRDAVNNDEARWMEIGETYVVWFGFVLGSWKALVSTSRPDGRYYEVVYNKTTDEIYIDIYQKIGQKVLPNWSNILKNIPDGWLD